MNTVSPEQLQGLIDSLGTSTFVDALAKTVLALVPGQLVRIQECGIESGRRTTLAEVARDPTMLRLDDLRRASLPESAAFSKDAWALEFRDEDGHAEEPPPGDVVTSRVRMVAGGIPISGRTCIVVAMLNLECGDDALALQRARLGRLLPLLRAVWHAHHRCLALESERNAVFQALDERGFGAMTLDRHAAPISINRRATDLMRDSGLLGFTPTRLFATDANDARRIREALAAILSELHEGRRGAPRAVTLTDSEKRATLRVQFCPTAAMLPGEGARTPTMVALMEDLQRDRRPDVRENAARFGLTAVETELACRLVQGQALDRAAAEQRISIHTARKYLQQIFGKTQTGRQADLVRLLISGALPSRHMDGAAGASNEAERSSQAADAPVRRAAQ